MSAALPVREVRWVETKTCTANGMAPSWQKVQGREGPHPAAHKIFIFSFKARVLIRLLVANNHAVSSSGTSLVCVVLRLAAAFGAIRVPATRASTIELDASTSASDAVAFASTARRSAGDGTWGTAVAAAGAERRHIGFHIRVGLVAVLLGVLVDLGSGELGCQLLQSRVLELLRADFPGLLRLVGSWRDDVGLGKWTTFGDTTAADAAGVARRRLLRGQGGVGSLAIGDIKDVELSLRGGLSDGLARGIMRDVVSVDDVVVPVALALLQCLALKPEGTFPASGLGSVLGQGKLAIVVVPGAEQVDGLDVGRSAKGEVKLDGGHYGLVFEMFIVRNGMVSSGENS